MPAYGNRGLCTSMKLKQCPVTVGQRTVMTEESFRIVCHYRMMKALLAKRVGAFENRYCLECLGKEKPKGLEIKHGL